MEIFDNPPLVLCCVGLDRIIVKIPFALFEFDTLDLTSFFAASCSLNHVCHLDQASVLSNSILAVLGYCHKACPQPTGT